MSHLSSPIEIVITGGPGAGKSTCLPYVRRHLQQLGFQVLTCPELPTILHSSGIDLAEAYADPQKLLSLERAIIKLQWETTNLYRDLARHLYPDQPCVIIYDRGISDASAFLARPQFLGILKSLNVSIAQARDDYHAVIALVSPAVDRHELYTVHNNRARFESRTEAATRDLDTQTAWLGHPHLRIIPSTADFSSKLAQLTQELNHIVANPPTEIERKFLLAPELASVNLSYLLDLPVYRRHITQSYLQEHRPGHERRLRRQLAEGELSFVLTEKQLIAKGTRIEDEHPVDRHEYRHLLAAERDLGRRDVVKTRYYFIWNHRQVELDVYESHPNLVVAEVELSQMNQTPDLLPPQLRVIKEVTSDESFANSTLAKLTPAA